MNAASSSMSIYTSGSSGRIHTPLQHLKILMFRNGGVCKKVMAFHMGRQCKKRLGSTEHYRKRRFLLGQSCRKLYIIPFKGACAQKKSGWHWASTGLVLVLVLED